MTLAELRQAVNNITLDGGAPVEGSGESLFHVPSRKCPECEKQIDSVPSWGEFDGAEVSGIEQVGGRVIIKFRDS